MKKKIFLFKIHWALMKRITICFFLLLSGANVALQPVSAQSIRKTITGSVVDNNGETVIGANVREKGTSNGTITDVDGKFTLQVSDQSVLQISFIGYNPVEVSVGNQQTFAIRLLEDTQLLDEVVVVGYGTVRRKDVTGAVGSLRARDVGNISVTNLEQMIQGRIAGVDVINNSGLPGTGTKIMIRGVGTIYNSDPLYVIDGIAGDINSVSQYDIESIEILKDASSTAIYGARAANGVVLVTTKRGQRGAPKVTLNAYVGIASPTKKLELLDANQYIDYALEMNPNFFRNARRFLPVSEGGLGYDEAWARVDRTRIQDEIFRDALQQEYHLNINGGGDNSLYNVSGTYTDMDAITKGYNYARFTLMANMEFTIRKYVKLGSNLSVRRTNTKNQTVDYVGALRWAPYMPTVDPNNSWGYARLSTAIDLNDTFNPMTDLNLANPLNKSTNIREQAYIEVSFLDMFKWRSQVQYSNSSNNNMSWTPYRENGQMQNQATISDNYGYSESSMLENYLNFNKEIGIHSFNAMVGNTFSSAKFNNSRSVNTSGNGTTSVPWENYDVLLVTRTPSYTVSSNSASYDAYLSYYGRINYILKDRYLFTFNYRQDASPKFSPKNRWGRFPSVALAWKMEEETFIRNIEILSQAKLRLSWGKSGNDRIDSYAYVGNVFNNSGGVIAAIGTGQSMWLGSTINGLPAPNIRWETTTSYNVGLDLGFNNNAFTSTINVYSRLTDGILIRVPVPYSTGIVDAPLSNAAEVSNIGFEFEAGYNKSFGDLRLSVTGNVSYNKNEVISLGAGEPIMSSQVRTEVGYPIGFYYGYVVDKVLSTTAEAQAYNQKFGTNAKAGDIAFKDVAGPRDANKKPTGPDGKLTADDRTFIGTSIPPWSYGMNISANFRQFDAQVGLSGLAGNKLYDQTRIFEMEGMQRIFNQSAEVLKRWKKEGDITHVPRAIEADPNDNRRISDRYIKDGSFLRISNVTIGYSVPLVTNPVIERLRLYISCQNAYVFTKYNGYDPEFGSSDTGASNYNMRRGVVSGGNMTPIPRTFMFGLQATF
jgi:TonB-linked SusC/RagA family outer membrane protein